MANGSTVREYQHYVNGNWSASDSGRMIDRKSPATGEFVARFADGTPADTNKAIAVARNAFDSGPWPRMSGMERGRVLFRLAEKMRSEIERLARIETEENGKPIRMARGDIEGSIGLIEYAAGLAQQMHGESYTNFGDKHTALVVREPVGVVGLITPWNFPALIYCQKMPFALAAGCTVVVKPSEFTSSTTIEITRLAEKAGVPAGVINVVTGYGPQVGQALVDSPDIDFISFTGSTATGQRIIAGAAGTMKKTSVELGGKSANIVFADADLDDAADGAMFGIFFNNGETCCAGSRLIIEDSIADAFLDKLAQRAKRLKVGNPMQEDTDIGALIHPEHAAKVMGFIKQGQEQGAKLLTGGHQVESEACPTGCFVAPTIFDHVGQETSIFQEEIFGPVLSVTRFHTMEEAIAIANNSKYGLASAVWTKDVDKAMIVSREMKAGTVWVNTMIDGSPQLPFGGYKGSGFGREMGQAGFEEFTELKAINIHIGKRTPYYTS
ncbi:aldehyde dehydrogenase family protein [Paenibacillaceae bacterium WGS1546]|uniref:aldehyde dehydrogenase family protein n=1 Tax=Cohnella sp. WGS1546 TaxID=3366810 RepID=UPI00372D562D